MSQVLKVVEQASYLKMNTNSREDTSSVDLFVRAKEPAGLSTFSDTWTTLSVLGSCLPEEQKLTQAKDKALFAVLDCLLEIFYTPPLLLFSSALSRRKKATLPCLTLRDHQRSTGSLPGPGQGICVAVIGC